MADMSLQEMAAALEKAGYRVQPPQCESCYKPPVWVRHTLFLGGRTGPSYYCCQDHAEAQNDFDTLGRDYRWEQISGTAGIM